MVKKRHCPQTTLIYHSNRKVYCFFFIQNRYTLHSTFGFSFLLTALIKFVILAIILPNQSITEDKSHELTNSRNLTLNDLVTQLRHYSANVRKGIQTFIELFIIVMMTVLICVDFHFRCSTRPERFVQSIPPNLTGIFIFGY